MGKQLCIFFKALILHITSVVIYLLLKHYKFFSIFNYVNNERLKLCFIKVDQHSVLRVTVLGVKNGRKKIYVDVFVIAIAHLLKTPITACLENVPDSRYSAYGREY